MKRRPALAALIAFAAMLLALGAARATDYLNNPNPACRTMRNSVAGAPLLPEPNRDDTRKAMGLAGGDMPAVGNMPVIRRDSTRRPSRCCRRSTARERTRSPRCRRTRRASIS